MGRADQVAQLLAAVDRGALTPDRARLHARRAAGGQSLAFVPMLAGIRGSRVAASARGTLASDLAAILGGQGPAGPGDDEDAEFAEFDALYPPRDAAEAEARAAQVATAASRRDLTDEELFDTLYPPHMRSVPPDGGRPARPSFPSPAGLRCRGGDSFPACPGCWWMGAASRPGEPGRGPSVCYGLRCVVGSASIWCYQRGNARLRPASGRPVSATAPGCGDTGS
jgi:hypothetical protein